MRFFQRYTTRMRRLRPVFDGHLEVVVTGAVALSLAGLLAASLIASRAAVVPVVGLSACAGAVCVGYLVRPKARLRRAARIGLRRGEFHVVYQPIVDMRTRHCVGMEALLRWDHPKFGAGGPGQFIGELEGTRLLCGLTRFVLREANSALTQLPLPVSRRFRHRLQQSGLTRGLSVRPRESRPEISGHARRSAHPVSEVNSRVGAYTWRESCRGRHGERCRTRCGAALGNRPRAGILVWEADGNRSASRVCVGEDVDKCVAQSDRNGAWSVKDECTMDAQQQQQQR